jgi:tetratricopeptide (TPR) repeat protein
MTAMISHTPHTTSAAANPIEDIESIDFYGGEEEMAKHTELFKSIVTTESPIARYILANVDTPIEVIARAARMTADSARMVASSWRVAELTPNERISIAQYLQASGRLDLLCRNISLNAEQIEQLAARMPEAAPHLVQNPSASPSFLKGYGIQRHAPDFEKDPAGWRRRWIEQVGPLSMGPEEALNQLTNHDIDVKVLEKAIKKALKALDAADDGWHERANDILFFAAKNLSFGLIDQDVFAAMSRKAGGDVRAAMAANKTLEHARSEVFADDPSQRVRLALARNPSTRPQILKKLARDPLAKVSAVARSRVAGAKIHSWRAVLDRNTFSEVVDLLWAAPETPTEALLYAVTLGGYRAALVAERDDVWAREGVVEAIFKRNATEAIEELAKHSEIDGNTAVWIAKRGHGLARLGLAENTNAGLAALNILKDDREKDVAEAARKTILTQDIARSGQNAAKWRSVLDQGTVEEARDLLQQGPDKVPTAALLYAVQHTRYGDIVASLEYVPDIEEVVDAILQSYEIAPRMALARNPYLTRDLAVEMAEDETSGDVKLALANNSSAPADALWILLRDNRPAIVRAAKNSLRERGEDPDQAVQFTSRPAEFVPTDDEIAGVFQRDWHGVFPEDPVERYAFTYALSSTAWVLLKHDPQGPEHVARMLAWVMSEVKAGTFPAPSAQILLSRVLHIAHINSKLKPLEKAIKKIKASKRLYDGLGEDWERYRSGEELRVRHVLGRVRAGVRFPEGNEASALLVVLARENLTPEQAAIVLRWVWSAAPLDMAAFAFRAVKVRARERGVEGQLESLIESDPELQRFDRFIRAVEGLAKEKQGEMERQYVDLQNPPPVEKRAPFPPAPAPRPVPVPAPPPARSPFREDMSEAAWRVAASQTVKATAAVVAAKMAGGDAQLEGRIAQFLRTDLGSSMLAALVSSGLSAMGAGGGALTELSRQLRIKAMSDAGEIAAELLSGPLRAWMSAQIAGEMPSPLPFHPPAPAPPRQLPAPAAVPWLAPEEEAEKVKK